MLILVLAAYLSRGWLEPSKKLFWGMNILLPWTPFPCVMAREGSLLELTLLKPDTQHCFAWNSNKTKRVIFYFHASYHWKSDPKIQSHIQSKISLLNGLKLHPQIGKYSISLLSNIRWHRAYTSSYLLPILCGWLVQKRGSLVLEQ